MEEKILELLQEIKAGQEELRAGQEKLRVGQQEINKQLDGVVEQTANLLEFREETISTLDDIKSRLDFMELVTANNYRDIALIKQQNHNKHVEN